MPIVTHSSFFVVICILSSIVQKKARRLVGTGVDDSGVTPGGTRLGTAALDGVDDVLATGDLTEDDVLAVQPGGDDGGDEELGTVAVYHC